MREVKPRFSRWLYSISIAFLNFLDNFIMNLLILPSFISKFQSINRNKTKFSEYLFCTKNINDHRRLKKKKKQFPLYNS